MENCFKITSTHLVWSFDTSNHFRRTDYVNFRYLNELHNQILHIFRLHRPLVTTGLRVKRHMASVRQKGPSDITYSVDPDQPLHNIENCYTSSNYLHSKNICDIDVTSVKKCRPWPDAASETRQLVLVYTFCTCPKVRFRMTLAILFVLPQRRFVP